MEHFPRLIFIEDGGAHAVGEAIAAREHAVIEHEPALVGFNRSRTRSDFCSFPVLDRAHNKAMLTPISEVFRLTDEYIAVRGVSPVARANKQKILAVHLARERTPLRATG